MRQNLRIGKLQRPAFAAGFTLLEVLVALAIVGTALGASVRAVGSLSRNSGDLRVAMLASWSAENRLVSRRIEKEWPPIGKTSEDCSQDDVHLVCEEEITAMQDKRFRRIEIVVVDGENPDRHLYRLVNMIPNGL